MFAFCFVQKIEGRLRCAALAAFCSLFVGLHLPAAQPVAGAAFAVNNVTYHYGPPPNDPNAQPRWRDPNGDPLDQPTLLAHLNNAGQNVLQELGRLILAQDNPDAHNVAANNAPNYFVLNGARKVADFSVCPTILGLAKHLFRAGHLGRYLAGGFPLRADHIVEADDLRGMFNLAGVVQDGGGAGVHLPLYRPPAGNWWGAQAGVRVLDERGVRWPTICDMLASFFSQPVGMVPWPALRPCSAAQLQLCVQDGQHQNRVNINFTIAHPAGGVITNLQPGQLCGICSEIQLPGGRYARGALTNEFCLVVEVSNGKIILITLYPFG